MISSRDTPAENPLAPESKSTTVVTVVIQHPTLAPQTLARLQPLLQLLDNKIIKGKTSKVERVTDILSWGIGGIGAYSSFPLGGGFGKIIGTAAHASETTLRFLNGFFGIIAYLPTMALVVLSNQYGLLSLVSLGSEERFLFRKSDRIKSRRAASFLKYFFSLLAGLPFIALNILLIDGDLGIGFAAIAGLASFASALGAQSRLSDNFFLHYEPAEIKALRLRFNNRVNQAQRQINLLSNETLVTLYDYLAANADQGAAPPMETLTKIKRLLLPGPAQSAPPLAGPGLGSATAKAIKAISMAIGTAAVYALHTATEVAIDWLNTQAGITQPETRENVRKTITSLALVPHALFSFSFIEQKIQKFCLDWVKGQRCPTGKELLATVISSASSTPNTYLAITTASNALEFVLIVPAFLGPMFARSLAFGLLINRGIHRYNRVFHKDDPATRREILLEMLEKLRQTFFALDPVYLYELETAYLAPAQAAALPLPPTPAPMSAPVPIAASAPTIAPVPFQIQTRFPAPMKEGKTQHFPSSPSHRVAPHFFKSQPQALELPSSTPGPSIAIKAPPTSPRA